MKIQIRGSVFETNSSSMHSIAIVKPENLKGSAADYYDELGYEWLKPGEKIEINHPIVLNDDSLIFGRWPFRILSTLYNKAQYAIASYGTEEKFNEISDICEQLTGHSLKTPNRCEWFYYYTTGLKDGDEIPDDHVLMEKNMEFDPQKKVWFRTDENGNKVYDIESGLEEIPYYGYIDHQSMGLLQNFLSKHNITLRQFLADPKYVVIIDGDEYCAWSKMFEAGVCLRENFIDPGLPDY